MNDIEFEDEDLEDEDQPKKLKLISEIIKFPLPKSNNSLLLQQILFGLKKNYIDPKLVNFLNKYINNPKDPDFLKYLTYALKISDIYNTNFFGEPLLVTGYISSIVRHYVKKIKVENNDGTIEEIHKSYVKVFISDKYSFSISAVDIPTDLIPDIRSLLKYDQLLFEGTIVYDQVRDGDFEFLILSVRKNIDLIHLIGDPGISLDELNKKVLFYNTKFGLRKFIKNEICSNIGIKGLENATDLDTAIDFMILQSFSYGLGNASRYSNKLHSLVIGPPASGKKLLTIIARSINPISSEITSSPAKITPAGLIGKVISSSSGSKSKPGLFPLNSNGVVCIQDFHEVAHKEGQKVYPIFSTVMEDGKAMDSTTAMWEHQAFTSIHLDMNRISQVKLNEKVDNYSDLGIPINIISRFDFIIEIPKDIARSWEVLTDMNKATEIGRILATTNDSKTIPPWALFIQEIIAYTVSHYKNAIIPSEVNEYIQSKFDELREKNSNVEFLQDILGDMLIRMKISIDKMIKAIACSELSNSIKKEYVDEAFNFLSYKIGFLKEFEVIEVPEAYKIAKKDKIERDKEIIQEKCQNQELSLDQICEKVNDCLSQKRSKDSIRDYLDDMVAREKFNVSKKAHGLWQFGDLKSIE